MRNLLVETLCHPDNHPEDLSDAALVGIAKVAREADPSVPLPIDFYATAATRGLILTKRKG